MVIFDFGHLRIPKIGLLQHPAKSVEPTRGFRAKSPGKARRDKNHASKEPHQSRNASCCRRNSTASLGLQGLAADSAQPRLVNTTEQYIALGGMPNLSSSPV